MSGESPAQSQSQSQSENTHTPLPLSLSQLTTPWIPLGMLKTLTVTHTDTNWEAVRDMAYQRAEEALKHNKFNSILLLRQFVVVFV